jgi:hypothetical protein
MPFINSQDSVFLSRDVQQCPHRQQQFHVLLTAHEKQMASQRPEKQMDSMPGQTLQHAVPPHHWMANPFGITL